MDKTAWWKRGIIYQIYPRSFQDTDADGVGDLKGIRERLNYLSWLGVDAIWISPIYPSPMADFGYDVSNYCDIDPLFGSLHEFDQLIAGAHKRGIKVILDFVPNHTSDRHPWFLESRASKSSPKRDWYIWRTGKPDGSPPNNWLSQFGGPAWNFDPVTSQYYLHSFLREQPDLNWRNPAVRTAMYDVLRFWLERGVDGFRVDVIWLLIKDAELRDNPANPDYRATDPASTRFLSRHNADQPETQEIVAEMRSVLEQYDERVLIGEIYLPIERLVAYYGKDLRGAHLPFNFQLIQTAWTADAIARLVREYEQALPPGGWPNWVLGNHDRPRIASRVGGGQAPIAAMLLLTLRGTPTMYYGDELGIGNVTIPPEALQDPWEKNEPGLGLGRDPSRTPFQWDATKNAGFTDGRPWLPVSPSYKSFNVATLRNDPTSLLSLYRRLLSIRRHYLALSIGKYRLIGVQGNAIAYERVAEGERIITCLNFGGIEQRISVQEVVGSTILASTHGDRAHLNSDFVLRADEGLVALCAPSGNFLPDAPGSEFTPSSRTRTG
ncbi:MAG TPA: alpha-amylase family glycosyl hydrolase [Pseudolabrys sp.]|nr:alpha-amylase family glycosyl hydrolase [Pseudolabrys sp.]